MLRKKSKFPIRTVARWKIWKTSLVRFLRNVRIAGRRGGQQKIASAISIAHLIIESPRRTTRSLRWRRKKKKSRNAFANAGTWPDRKRNATQFRLNSVYTPIHILFYIMALAAANETVHRNFHDCRRILFPFSKSRPKENHNQIWAHLDECDRTLY